MSYQIRRNCRACGYGPPLNDHYFKSGESKESLVQVLDLGVMPLPNAFRGLTADHPGHYPIKLMACPKCGLGQLSAVVDPNVMYANYPYVTSTSKTMQCHFEKIFTDLQEETRIKTVLEIGSNDGLCLEFFRNKGVEHVVGVDPSQNLTKISRERGITTFTSLFDSNVVALIKECRPAIDVILARHVFCHIDKWRQFIKDLEILCGQETVVAIEVPWAHRTIESNEWDQVYAEHLSYMTVHAMVALLEGTMLGLSRVIEYPIHGGSIMLILRRRDSAVPVRDSVPAFLLAEKCRIDDWVNFGVQARSQISAMRNFIYDIRCQGKRICGYGASAKGTVWMNAIGATKSEIYGVYDSTLQKCYCNVPGTNIPVIHEGAFYVDKPDVAIIWAWNFADEIKFKQSKWVAEGGKFAVPVPTPHFIV